MSRVCDLIAAKKPMSGHNVSHSNRKTARKFDPNLQTFTLKSDALRRDFKLKLATNTIRTIDKHNGFDGFLRSVKTARLTPFGRQLKKKLFSIEGKPEAKPAKVVKAKKATKPKQAASSKEKAPKEKA